MADPYNLAGPANASSFLSKWQSFKSSSPELAKTPAYQAALEADAQRVTRGQKPWTTNDTARILATGQMVRPLTQGPRRDTGLNLIGNAGSDIAQIGNMAGTILGGAFLGDIPQVSHLAQYWTKSFKEIHDDKKNPSLLDKIGAGVEQLTNAPFIRSLPLMAGPLISEVGHTVRHPGALTSSAMEIAQTQMDPSSIMRPNFAEQADRITRMKERAKEIRKIPEGPARDMAVAEAKQEFGPKSGFGRVQEAAHYLSRQLHGEGARFIPGTRTAASFLELGDTVPGGGPSEALTHPIMTALDVLPFAIHMAKGTGVAAEMARTRLEDTSTGLKPRPLSAVAFNKLTPKFDETGAPVLTEAGTPAMEVIRNRPGEAFDHIMAETRLGQATSAAWGAKARATAWVSSEMKAGIEAVMEKNPMTTAKATMEQKYSAMWQAMVNNNEMVAALHEAGFTGDDMVAFHKAVNLSSPTHDATLPEGWLPWVEYVRHNSDENARIGIEMGLFAMDPESHLIYSTDQWDRRVRSSTRVQRSMEKLYFDLQETLPGRVQDKTGGDVLGTEPSAKGWAGSKDFTPDFFRRMVARMNSSHRVPDWEPGMVDPEPHITHAMEQAPLNTEVLYKGVRAGDYHYQLNGNTITFTQHVSASTDPEISQFFSVPVGVDWHAHIAPVKVELKPTDMNPEGLSVMFKFEPGTIRDIDLVRVMAAHRDEYNWDDVRSAMRTANMEREHLIARGSYGIKEIRRVEPGEGVDMLNFADIHNPDQAYMEVTLLPSEAASVVAKAGGTRPPLLPHANPMWDAVLDAYQARNPKEALRLLNQMRAGYDNPSGIVPRPVTSPGVAHKFAGHWESGVNGGGGVGDIYKVIKRLERARNKANDEIAGNKSTAKGAMEHKAQLAARVGQYFDQMTRLEAKANEQLALFKEKHGAQMQKWVDEHPEIDDNFRELTAHVNHPTPLAYRNGVALDELYRKSQTTDSSGAFNQRTMRTPKVLTNKQFDKLIRRTEQTVRMMERDAAIRASVLAPALHERAQMRIAELAYGKQVAQQPITAKLSPMFDHGLSDGRAEWVPVQALTPLQTAPTVRGMMGGSDPEVIETPSPASQNRFLDDQYDVRNDLIHDGWDKPLILEYLVDLNKLVWRSAEESNQFFAATQLGHTHVPVEVQSVFGQDTPMADAPLMDASPKLEKDVYVKAATSNSLRPVRGIDAHHPSEIVGTAFRPSEVLDFERSIPISDSRPLIGPQLVSERLGMNNNDLQMASDGPAQINYHGPESPDVSFVPAYNQQYYFPLRALGHQIDDIMDTVPEYVELKQSLVGKRFDEPGFQSTRDRMQELISEHLPIFRNDIREFAKQKRDEGWNKPIDVYYVDPDITPYHHRALQMDAMEGRYYPVHPEDLLLLSKLQAATEIGVQQDIPIRLVPHPDLNEPHNRSTLDPRSDPLGTYADETRQDHRLGPKAHAVLEARVQESNAKMEAKLLSDPVAHVNHQQNIDAIFQDIFEHRLGQHVYISPEQAAEMTPVQITQYKAREMSKWSKEASLMVQQMQQIDAANGHPGPVFVPRIDADQAKSIGHASLAGRIKEPTSAKDRSSLLMPKQHISEVGLSLSHQSWEFMHTQQQTAFANYIGIRDGQSLKYLEGIYGEQADRIFNTQSTSFRTRKQIMESLIGRGWVEYHPEKFFDFVKPRSHLYEDEVVYIPKSTAMTLDQMRKSGTGLLERATAIPLTAFRTSVVGLSIRAQLYNLTGGAGLVAVEMPSAVKMIGIGRSLVKMNEAGLTDVFNALNATGRVPEHLIAEALQTPEFRASINDFGGARQEHIELQHQSGIQIHSILERAAASNSPLVRAFAHGSTILGHALKPIKGLSDMGIKLNSFVDDMGKSALMLEKMMKGLEKGVAPAEAVREAIAVTRQTAMNWKAMTPFERSALRPIIPFYAWMRHILQFSINFPLDHPFRTALMADIMALEIDDEKTGYPAAFRNLVFFGDKGDGKPSNGGKQNAFRMGGMNPFSSMESAWGMLGFFGGDAAQAGSALGSLNPIVKYAMQTAGVDPRSMTGDPFPETRFDPKTTAMEVSQLDDSNWIARLASTFIPQIKALGPLVSQVPGGEGVGKALSFGSERQTQQRTDPGAYRRSVASDLGLPNVWQNVNVAEKVGKLELALNKAEKEVIRKAILSGDYSQAKLWPGLADKVEQMPALIKRFPQLFAGMKSPTTSDQYTAQVEQLTKLGQLPTNAR